MNGSNISEINGHIDIRFDVIFRVIDLPLQVFGGSYRSEITAFLMRSPDPSHNK